MPSPNGSVFTPNVLSSLGAVCPFSILSVWPGFLHSVRCLPVLRADGTRKSRAPMSWFSLQALTKRHGSSFRRAPLGAWEASPAGNVGQLPFSRAGGMPEDPASAMLCCWFCSLYIGACSLRANCGCDPIDWASFDVPSFIEESSKWVSVCVCTSEPSLCRSRAACCSATLVVPGITSTFGLVVLRTVCCVCPVGCLFRQTQSAPHH